MTEANSDVPGGRNAGSFSHSQRIVFKFRDHVRLPHDLDLTQHLAAQATEPLAAGLECNPGLTIRRYFTALDPGALDKLASRGESYQVHARQLFEGEEVGRVTWRMTAATRSAG